MAKEAPPGEYVKEAREELTPEEMADLLDLDEEAKYEGISVGFEVSADGAFGIKKSTDVGTRGVCVRTPFGPGKVKWNFPNPGSGGAGYSVLPESSGSLIWANPPSQGIDGIYRTSWGACTALKVPNSCTVTYHSSSSGEVCCHAILWEHGVRVEWVNPCDAGSDEAGWPDNPLE
jgi:hypothetical protein